jgi:hypothetical protein
MSLAMDLARDRSLSDVTCPPSVTIPLSRSCFIETSFKAAWSKDLRIWSDTSGAFAEVADGVLIGAVPEQPAIKKVNEATTVKIFMALLFPGTFPD